MQTVVSRQALFMSRHGATYPQYRRITCHDRNLFNPFLFAASYATKEPIEFRDVN
jgi:hypothetical protein